MEEKRKKKEKAYAILGKQSENAVVIILQQCVVMNEYIEINDKLIL